MKKRKKPLFFVLEESPVYRQIIPACIQAVIENGVIKVFDNPDKMLTAASLKPDLIISEYSFSNQLFNGNDILYSVKEKSPATDVIFLTAHHDLVSAVSAIKSGAYDYIPKSKNALERLIQITLSLKNKRDKLYKSNRIINRMVAFLLLVIAILLILTLFYYIK